MNGLVILLLGLMILGFDPYYNFAEGLISHLIHLFANAASIWCKLKSIENSLAVYSPNVVKHRHRCGLSFILISLLGSLFKFLTSELDRIRLMLTSITR